jgi:hypothetical protein
MKVIECGRWLIVIVLLSFGCLGNASVVSSTGYLQTASTLPLFLDTNETINVTKNGSGANTYWTLTGTGSHTSFFDGLLNSVNLLNDSVKYQANFNSAGQLITSIPSFGSTPLTNYLEINGSLSGGQYGAASSILQTNQLLLKANLISSGSNNNTLDSFAGIALGFKAEFTDGWAYNHLSLAGGSSTESLWLLGLSSNFQNLVKALDGDSSNGTLSSLFRSSRTINGAASITSIAAVPAPGAVWLFGTGLMTLLAAGRRKSIAAKLAA